jgi:predicted amidohydrolase YtcJ
MLSRDKDTGSLEVGKSADFIIVDRNIVNLGESGHAADIAGTRVLATWFQGKKVYAAD